VQLSWNSFLQKDISCFFPINIQVFLLISLASTSLPACTAGPVVLLFKKFYISLSYCSLMLEGTGVLIAIFLFSFFFKLIWICFFCAKKISFVLVISRYFFFNLKILINLYFPTFIHSIILCFACFIKPSPQIFLHQKLLLKYFPQNSSNYFRKTKKYFHD